MFKKFLVSFLLLSLLFSFFACTAERVYSHCEMVLPLTEDFEVIENSDFDVAYSNGTAAVALLRISFSAAFIQGIPETFNTEEFGAFWLRQCSRTAEITRYRTIAHCTYEERSGGTDYYCLAAFYRTQYAYFVVICTVKSTLKDEWNPKFLDYISGVYFVDYETK